jgi:Xaa-Pro aminopeptidase
MWSKKQIRQHVKAAKQLDEIIQQAFDFIKKHSGEISEYDVQNFILDEFKKRNLITHDQPIVAFGRNTMHVHYFAQKLSALKLIPKSIIMIDIWARVNEPKAPFADITWVGYFGKKVPRKIMGTFGLVVLARDRAVDYIKKSLETNHIPTGKEVDQIAREIFKEKELDNKFLHGLGHSLGFVSAHGRYGGRLKPAKKSKPLKWNVGYTIEPALYYKGLFGVRSEIDFYLNDEFELIITTCIQKEIIIF